jgi:hypothetical protein
MHCYIAVIFFSQSESSEICTFFLYRFLVARGQLSCHDKMELEDDFYTVGKVCSSSMGKVDRKFSSCCNLLLYQWYVHTMDLRGDASAALTWRNQTLFFELFDISDQTSWEIYFRSSFCSNILFITDDNVFLRHRYYVKWYFGDRKSRIWIVNHVRMIWKIVPDVVRLLINLNVTILDPSHLMLVPRKNTFVFCSGDKRKENVMKGDFQSIFLTEIELTFPMVVKLSSNSN